MPHIIRLHGPWNFGIQGDFESSIAPDALLRFKFDQPLSIQRIWELVDHRASNDESFGCIRRSFNWPNLSELERVRVELRIANLPDHSNIKLNDVELAASQSGAFEVHSNLKMANVLELCFGGSVNIDAGFGPCELCIFETS